MKLFLHWLRWDLRRFRVMLLLWTLLVLAHALILGWLGWKMPMVGEDPGFHHTAVSSANFLSVLLGLAAIFLLLYVLTTDPAGGSLSFWKVRPPSGYSVAGAKVVICLGAFLLLPAAIHALVALWVAPAALAAPVVLGPAGTIVALAATTIGFLLVGAAAAGSPQQVIVRLTGMFILFVLLLILAGLASKFGKVLLDLPFDRLSRIIAHSLSPLILLLMGLLAFIGARKSRQPPRIYPLLTTLSPLLLVVVPFLPASSTPKPKLEKQVPPMDPGGALKVRVLEPLLSKPVISGGPGTSLGSFTFSFRIGGLGELSVASAEIQDLTLEGPEGTRLSTGNSATAKFSYPMDGSFWFSILSFDSASAARLAMEPCRLSGTIRFVLARPLKSDFSLDPAKVSTSAFGKHRVQSERHMRGRLVDEWSLINAWAGPSPDRLSFTLENPQAGDEIMITAKRESLSGPVFSLFRQQRVGLSPAKPVPELMWAKVVSAERKGTLSADWHLRMTATVPWAWVDVPVALDLAVIPGNDRDAGAVLEKLSAIRLDPSASPQERLRLIRYACILADSLEGRAYKIEPRESDPGMLATAAVMEQLCESIQPDLTGPLLDWIAEVAAYNLEKGSIALNALRKRLVALIEPVHKVRLRSKPEMWAWINGEPPAAGANPVPTGTSFSLQDLDDTALEERWKTARLFARLYSSPLAEALRRGLPWAIPALAEVVEFLPDSDAMHDLEPVVRSVVGEPIPQWDAAKWLAPNVHRLVWDPASKKWILPSSAPAAPASK